MTKSPYPQHITDPVRRKIAEEYLAHEFRKFFSTINDKETWAKIDAEIKTWFNGHYTFAPVRDFWNGLHGISRGIKLKNIVSWLTSENIVWSEEHIEVEKLYFGVNFKEFSHLPLHPPVEAVMKHFATLSEEERNKLKQEHLVQTPHKNPVDHYPILAVERENKLTVIDGNRRLRDALLLKETRIFAALGRKIAEPAIFNEWVPTSLLLDLIGLNRLPGDRNPVSEEALTDVIVALIVNSETGKYEFFHRAINEKNEKDQSIKQLVEEKLNSKKSGNFSE